MTHSRTVTLIRHHHNPTELDDNAVRHLQKKGYEIRHCYPFDGETLDPDKDLTPSIVLGGSQNVTELAEHPYLSDEIRWIKAAMSRNMPLLGICLGAQLIAHALGAKVGPRTPPECEYGFYTVHPTAAAINQRFLNMPMKFMQAHCQEFTLPRGALRLASSDRFSEQAFIHGENTIALQFHPEVSHDIFHNWLEDDWSADMVQINGAQGKAEQALEHDEILTAQARWFETLLDRMFNELAQ